MASGGNYKLPKDAKYLVIDIRGKENWEPLEDYVLHQDGKIISLVKFNPKQYLMRVVYEKDFSELRIYLEENKQPYKILKLN